MALWKRIRIKASMSVGRRIREENKDKGNTSVGTTLREENKNNGVASVGSVCRKSGSDGLVTAVIMWVDGLVMGATE